LIRSRLRGGRSLLLLVALGAFFIPQSALAATWTAQSLSLPPGSESELDATSCTYLSGCDAAGSYTKEGVTRPLVEVFNGTTWTRQEPPQPGASSWANLNGITCRSTSFCFAVGEYVSTGSTMQGFIERWNGTSWKGEVWPAGKLFAAVSCRSETDCVTVGVRHGVPLAMHWNGSNWSVQTLPTLTGPKGEATTDAVLRAVKCVEHSCLAVGSYEGAEVGRELPLTMHQEGESPWELVSSPQPPAGTGYVLNGVDCAYATACHAVGESSTGTPESYRTLKETWPGTKWILDSGSGEPGELTSIGCGGVASCRAGGQTVVGEPGPSWIETETGGVWSFQTLPGLSKGPVEGVSCAGVESCIAVGKTRLTYGQREAVAWRLN
jgi:hypothetical protein